MPSTVNSVGPASAGVRAIPACPRPAASNASRVASTPAAPLSMAWFEASEHRSKPALAIAAVISAGTP